MLKKYEKMKAQISKQQFCPGYSAYEGVMDFLNLYRTTKYSTNYKSKKALSCKHSHTF